MKQRRQKRTIGLPVDDWRELERVADRVGATAKTGDTAGEPSISALLRLIAAGELVVKRRVGRPRK
jgi:hypothetical protein